MARKWTDGRRKEVLSRMVERLPAWRQNHLVSKAVKSISEPLSNGLFVPFCATVVDSPSNDLRKYELTVKFPLLAACGIGMLTRREKLLIRPWQQRRFNQHRRKVQTALPAIDASAPPIREHVSHKLKKQQWEVERSARIEKDNCRLLHRMGIIMKTKRLDNEWLHTPPNFLHRIGIYYDPEKDVSKLETLESLDSTPEDLSTRKSRCSACNPRKPKHTMPPLVWDGSPGSSFSASASPSPDTAAMRAMPPRRVESASSRLTVSRGALHLSVQFPGNATLRLDDRPLGPQPCGCRAGKNR